MLTIELQKEGIFKSTKLRKVKYLNNLIEQDHQRVKRKNRHALGYQSYKTAEKTICGVETMAMIFKRQIEKIKNHSAQFIKKFIEDLFESPILAH